MKATGNSGLRPDQTSVMLLAAGFGKRMKPLTDITPKPLLRISDRPLIEHHVRRLQKMGFMHMVVNVAHLGHQIMDYLGDGSSLGVQIEYSDESELGPLETAGGIVNALDLIRSDSFISINADVFTDFPFHSLLNVPTSPAHLVLVDNPSHNPSGDFSIDINGLLVEREPPLALTYSGIARYSKALFSELRSEKQALPPLFRLWLAEQKVSAAHYQGMWADIGTPERLDELNSQLQQV